MRRADQAALRAAEASVLTDLKTKTIFVINAKLFGGFACTVIVTWIWPSSPEWWGFGLYAILLGFGALALLIDAFKSMVRLRWVLQLIGAYEDQGSAPKGAAMASDDDLIAAGMLDKPAPTRRFRLWGARL